MSTITNASATGAALNAGGTTTGRIPTKTMDQQDFLKILVAQAKSQDPLNPNAETDFVSQMTQFSMLEQFKGVQTEMTGLRTGQDLTSANSLLGRIVEVDAGKQDRLLGLVSAVQIEAGKPKVVVGGRSFDVAKIIEVSPPVTEPAVQPLANALP